MPAFDLPKLPLPRDSRDTPYIGSYDASGYYTVPSSQWFKNASNLWVPVSATDRLPVDTELPAALVLTDATATPSAPCVGAVNMLYNESTMDLERGNHAVAVLSSAARTADATSDDQINHNCAGMFIMVDVAAEGSPSAGYISSIAVQRKVGSNYNDIYKFSSLSISTVGQYDFLIMPGVTSQGSLHAAPLSGAVPRDWRLVVGHGNQTDEVTYGITAGYVK